MLVTLSAMLRHPQRPFTPPGDATEVLLVRHGSAGPGAAGLAVAHGGTIAEACRQATGSEPFAFINVDNASITRLVRLAGGRWLLISFNDTAHLARDGHPAPG